MPLRATIMQPEDLLLLEEQDSQKLDMPRSSRLEMGTRLIGNGSAFTLWTDGPDGPRAVLCCGAHRLHGEYAQLWALFSRDKPKVPVQLTRIIRQYVADLRHDRVDTQVSAANERACRWMALIGLREEARLRRAMPDGSDMIVFVREEAE